MQSTSSSEVHLPAFTSVEQSRHVFSPDHASDESIQSNDKDLEKGDLGSKENNEVDQGDEDKRQTELESNLVGWDGPDDPENPQNWSKKKKYTTTVFYATLTFCLTFSSSIFSTATMVTAKMYGVSNEVMTLGTSLFVLVRSLLTKLASKFVLTHI